MGKIGRIKAFLVLSSLLLVAQGSAFAANPDESPLDLLISKELQQRIDLRKESESASRQYSIQSFRGSQEVDLRHRDTPVKQQFSAAKCVGWFHTKVGTCSAFGLAAAMENALGGGVELSERHLWSQYCDPSSSAALKAITKGKGMVEESWWPQNKVKRPGDLSKATPYKVLEFKSLEDNVPAMLEALDQGKPLYLAINTPSDMYARKAVISANSGKTGGGHAVAIVGYKLDESAGGGAYLLIKNSWGTSDTFTGYQWLATGYCAKKGNYCTVWSIDNVDKNQPAE